MKKPLALLVCAAMLAGMLAGCTQSPNPAAGTASPAEGSATPVPEPTAASLDPVTLVLMDVNGKTTSNTEGILAKINEITQKEINATLKLQTVTQDSYNINLTAIEDVDMILSADYLSYYDNARKAAYMPIAEEDVQKYCPTWYEDNKDKLVSATVDGKIYALPNAEPGMNAPIMILRKDLMDKYGVPEVKSLADLDKYFAAIKQNEPTMIPFALDTGTTAWLTGAYAFAATGLMAPGGPNCTSTVCLNKFDDPNYKLVRTWQQPVLIDFFKTMKDFADKGYWTQDVLANPVPLNDAFEAGTTAVAWATQPQSINSMYADMKVLLPEAELYAYDLGAEKNIPVDTYSPMGAAVSLPRTAKNYERALMFVELCYTNVELSRLFMYGIEGVNYSINDKGEVKILDPENTLGFYLPFTEREAYKYPPEGGYWPGYADMIAAMRAREQQNPFVGFGLDTSKISDMAANLWNVHMEYAVPIYLGLVDDVDAAVAELNKQYDNANLAVYEKEVYDQLQNFITTNGLKQTLTMP